MPSSTLPYFFEASLRARYIQDLADAARDSRISAEEGHWLQTLARPLSGDALIARPQASRLIRQSVSDADAEWAAAVMIFDPSGTNPAVYLSTLRDGLERFADRTLLLIALNERFAPQATSETYEQEVIEGPLFESRMLAIVRHQVGQLRAWGEILGKIPTLPSALGQGFKQRISSLLPDTSIDLSLPLVQVAQVDAVGEKVAVLYTQNFKDVLMERLAARALPAQHTRVFLSSAGQVADEAQTRLYEEAVSKAVEEVGPAYEDLLSDYWLSSCSTGQTMRDWAAAALAEGFCQELLASGHNATLTAHDVQRLGQLVLSAHPEATDRPRVKRLTLTVAAQAPLELGGVLLIELGSSLLLYSAMQGTCTIASLASLTSTDNLAMLRRHLSLNDQPLMARPGTLQIDSYDIEHPPFIEMIDAIIGLQKRNLRFALARVHTDEHESAAMISDALDIRHLLDRRLLHANGHGRWMEGETCFAERWLALIPPTAFDLTPAPILRDSQPVSWVEKVVKLEDRYARLDQLRPGIDSFARNALNEYLAVLTDPPFDALKIQLRRPAAGPPPIPQDQQATIGLIGLLLEHVSGRQAAALGDDAHIELAATEYALARPMPILSPAIINQMVGDIAPEFLSAYLTHLDWRYQESWRQPFRVFEPGVLFSRIQEDYLRLEYDVQKRLGNVSPQALAMFKQVQDLPVRAMRRQSGDEMTEVYAVSLGFDARNPPIPMSNIFVLQRPAMGHAGGAFWSALTGLGSCASLDALAALLTTFLRDASLRELCLGLFKEVDIPRIRACLEQSDPASLRIGFTRLDGHFLHAVQAVERERQRSKAEQIFLDAQRAHLQARELLGFARLAESDQRMLEPLSSLFTVIETLLLDDVLPPWLKQASLDDINVYQDLLDGYYVHSEPGEDFLGDIPALQQFAREQLLQQLQADYPGQSLNPDEVLIRLTHYVGAPVPLGNTPSFLPAATVVREETLTAFALNHFSGFQSATMTVTVPAGSAPTLQLTAKYCQTLVRKLDAGRQYRELLASRLDSGSEGYIPRRHRFVAQMPSRMLLALFELKLQGAISLAGYQTVKKLLAMPDDLAREDAAQDVTLRPFQLLASEGFTPDAVSGLYLIGPRDLTRGPVILHAIFHQEFSFTEYADQAALMADLQNRESFRTLVLNRLNPLVRKRYDNGGFVEAHIPWSTESYLDGPFGSPGPVRLNGEPVTGNVLHYLFDETLNVLKDISCQQTVTTAQADWQSLVYLMTLGADQILCFLPGKLGMLLGLWQSTELFKNSARSAYDWKLGKALSEFSAALSLLIGSRLSVEEQTIDNSTVSTGSNTHRRPQQSAFSWGRMRLSPGRQSRLVSFEVRDIALINLQHDALYNVYLDTNTNRHYAAVSGRVYRVQLDEDRWRVVGEQEAGPWLRLDAAQRWELDLDGRLRGGGANGSRFRSPGIAAELSESFIVEARGMREIRTMYRDKSLMIGQAHNQARDYLENCIYNLGPLSASTAFDHRTLQVFGDFFGTFTPGADLINTIRQMAIDLHRGLTDPSLSVLSSRRYVIGTNKPGHEGRAAFTFRSDSKGRIFLSERFFEMPTYTLDPVHHDYGRFDMSGHYRAGILIHELTHVVSHTNDIAYLEASAPFPDLLSTADSRAAAIKAGLERIRNCSLSHQSPAERLFRIHSGSGWRDLADSDGAGRARILHITEQTTLENARLVFFHNPRKRHEVMLANADSLAVLIMSLGRYRFLAN